MSRLGDMVRAGKKAKARDKVAEKMGGDFFASHMGKGEHKKYFKKSPMSQEGKKGCKCEKGKCRC